MRNLTDRQRIENLEREVQTLQAQLKAVKGQMVPMLENIKRLLKRINDLDHKDDGKRRG